MPAKRAEFSRYGNIARRIVILMLLDTKAEQFLTRRRGSWRIVRDRRALLPRPYQSLVPFLRVPQPARLDAVSAARNGDALRRRLGSYADRVRATLTAKTAQNQVVLVVLVMCREQTFTATALDAQGDRLADGNFLGVRLRRGTKDDAGHNRESSKAMHGDGEEASACQFVAVPSLLIGGRPRALEENTGNAGN